MFETPSAKLHLFKIAESIPSSTSMFGAMEALARTQRQGLAVVNPGGVLVGDISVTDLHDLPEANFSSLNMEVVHWLRAFSSTALTPPTTSNEVSLGTLIETFATKKTHRLWVVDDEGHPTHVVSLTDVLAAFSSGDHVDQRMASGDTAISHLWRIASPPLGSANEI